MFFFLATVLCLMAVLSGGQAQCPQGEVVVVTSATCGPTFPCQSDVDNSTIRGSILSIEPVNNDDCFYALIFRGTEIEAVSTTFGLCMLKVRMCVADTGTGENEAPPVCQENEVEMTTNATCDQPNSPCLGEDGSAIEGTVRALMISDSVCFYGLSASGDVRINRLATQTCNVQVISCLSDPSTEGGNGNTDGGLCGDDGEQSSQSSESSESSASR